MNQPTDRRDRGAILPSNVTPSARVVIGMHQATRPPSNVEVESLAETADPWVRGVVQEMARQGHGPRSAAYLSFQALLTERASREAALVLRNGGSADAAWMAKVADFEMFWLPEYHHRLNTEFKPFFDGARERYVRRRWVARLAGVGIALLCLPLVVVIFAAMMWMVGTPTDLRGMAWAVENVVGHSTAQSLGFLSYLSVAGGALIGLGVVAYRLYARLYAALTGIPHGA
jgi:hypothetical protein